MNNPTFIPYDWIKKIDISILQNDQVPLIGHPPSFPWDQLAQQIAKTLEVPSLELIPGELKWRSSNELFNGLDTSIPLELNVMPLEGKVFWILSTEDIKTIMATLLFKDSASSALSTQLPLSSDFIDGFYRFITVEILSQLSKIDFDRTLSYKLQTDGGTPSETSLCQDVAIKIADQTFWGRVVLSSDFMQSWRERYAARNVNTPINQEFVEKCTLPLSIEAGKVVLDYTEIASLSLGDFIKLDTCTMDPEEHKGLVNLTLNGQTLYRARFKGHELKILELPLYNEAPVAMEKNTPEDDWKDEDHDTNTDFDDNEDDFSFDDDFTDEHETVEEEHESVEEQSFENAQETGLEDEDHQAGGEGSPQASQDGKKAFDPNEIPVQLTIEMGKIFIPIQKLTELQPGNVLELNVKPEDGVNLVINGKCIGKGELLKIGEILGVRILDLGG